ncbi:MAG: TIM barrel protein [Candidatus Omnitrophica bacterium]|nr:TIM barrel protein [Candidatus Omnitrophota bacterium]
MISLSTTWNAMSHEKAETLLGEILMLGVKCVELGFSLNKDIVEGLADLYSQGLFKVSSVHNFCPIADGYDRSGFTPDFFSLSSPDNNLRAKAVTLTKGSIETTARFGAQALVIHAGRVEMPLKTKKLVALFNNGQRNSAVYESILKEMKEERQLKKKLYFDAILRSLEEIIKYAQKFKVNICLENRYYYREIPSPDEIESIFFKFKGCENLFYWHDVGHALAGEALGFYPAADYLNRFKDKLAGIHLHDVKGAADHLVPGKGDFNFSLLKPYIKKDTIKVMEVHRPADGIDIKEGISLLYKELDD